MAVGQAWEEERLKLLELPAADSWCRFDKGVQVEDPEHLAALVQFKHWNRSSPGATPPAAPAAPGQR